MADVKIVIGSITYTTKAKKVLNEHGITAYIAKYQEVSHHGCSYGLKINQANYIAAIGLLNEHHIKYHTLENSDDSLS